MQRPDEYLDEPDIEEWAGWILHNMQKDADAFPEGFTHNDIQQRYALPEITTRAAVLRLSSAGLLNEGKFQGNQYRFLPRGQIIKHERLTENQRKVLKLLTEEMGSTGFTTIPRPQIAQRAGVAKGSVSLILESLEKKDKIEIHGSRRFRVVPALPAPGERPSIEEITSRIIKAELARRSITYGKLAKMLRVFGWVESEKSVSKKINSDEMKAAWFMGVMAVIGVKSLTLDDVLPNALEQ